MNISPNPNSFRINNTHFGLSESSESGSELAEGCVGSDTISEYIPSETAEDRAFVSSDTEEQLSSSSDEILGHLDEVSITSIQQMEFLPPCKWNVADALNQNLQNKDIVPIKVMAKRSVSSEDGPVDQYLVLWYSWEGADKVLDTVGNMISDLHID